MPARTPLWSVIRNSRECGVRAAGGQELPLARLLRSFQGAAPAIGVTHSDLGEGVVAVVVPKGPQATDSEKILSALNGRLARFKVPRHVVIVDDLPRNTMGKVQKNVLRDQFKDISAAVT